MVLVAETSAGEIVAAGRLMQIHGTSDAEFALLVSDLWQEQGLGTELMHSLIGIARQEKVSCIFGQMMLENLAMQEICKQLGFDMEYSSERGVVEASLVLGG
jgi:acetyltransferase